MRKPCGVCGRIINNKQSLCWECLEEHGADIDAWPEWLVFAVRDSEVEWQRRIARDDLEYNDEIDCNRYTGAPDEVEGCYIPPYGELPGDNPWDVGRDIEDIYGTNMVYD